MNNGGILQLRSQNAEMFQFYSSEMVGNVLKCVDLWQINK